MKALLSLTLVLAWLERGSGSAGWVFTEPQLQASAGDSVLLRCLFLEPPAKGWTMAKVDWLRTEAAGAQKEEMVFYYYSNHSIPVGHFQHRVRWRGDVSHGDGSIQLRNVQVNDSGTYVCEVRLLQYSSIFKNHTVLYVSPRQIAGQGTADAQDSVAPGDSRFWPVTMGCCCVAVVLAFLAGLSLRKRYAPNMALERTGKGGSKNRPEEGVLMEQMLLMQPDSREAWHGEVAPGPLPPSEAESRVILMEALYSSIPVMEVPKAERDAGKKKRAEETYITMHPSLFRENSVYVELARRIPAEWMAAGRLGDGQSEEPFRAEVALP